MKALVNKIFLLSVFQFILCAGINAQCIVVDSLTPYFQDFELSSGNWTAGGTMSDWAWGKPSKPIIKGAATGQNCWITGDLNGLDYNAGERSYLISPCFDFSNLNFPYVEFKLFWETENRYDGNAFQYSLDNGITWLNVGAVGEPPNCLNKNWFNSSNISNLTGLGPNKEGWSGSIKPSSGSCAGGNGSGAWLTASHSLAGLRGKSKVIFRFTFGAGTLCNTYDGFAVDDIKISNAPPGAIDFTSGCISNRIISFTNLSSPCYPVYNWDFGDPLSGTSNISNSTNATHTFSGPGKYIVKLTASGGTGPATFIAKEIHVIDVKAIISNANTCNSSPNNATATATVSADAGVTGITYAWNTVPVAATPVVTGLPAGIFIVTASADNACPARDTVLNPQPLAHLVNKTDATCGTNNGIISILQSGGTMPYNFIWAPNVSVGPTASNLAPGNYVITITDNAGCKDSINASIVNNGGVSVSITNKTDAKCFGDNSGSASSVVSGSGGTFAYQWSGGSQTYMTPNIQNVTAGTYQLIVSDVFGCKDTATTMINEPPPIVIGLNLRPTFCGLKNGTAKANVTGGTIPYQYLWSSGATSDSASSLLGNVSLTVTDKNGCQQSLGPVEVKPSYPLSINLGKDIALCSGAQVKLYPGKFASYRWSNNATDSAIVANQTGLYWVSVIDSNGCAAIDTIKLSIEKCRDILFPDAFSPDGNSRNDNFGPVGSLSAVSDYTFRIFNRWGQLIFSSNDPYKKWNGKFNGAEAGTGVYVWTADYSFDRQPKKSVKGTVMLIR